MCSTPKPKRRVKSKTANSRAGILSSISNEKRLSFAERANQASERRIEAKQLKHEEQHHINKLIVTKPHSQNVKAKTDNKNQPWLYWLLNTPFSELIRKLVS